MTTVTPLCAACLAPQKNSLLLALPGGLWAYIPCLLEYRRLVRKQEGEKT